MSGSAGGEDGVDGAVERVLEVEMERARVPAVSIGVSGAGVSEAGIDFFLDMLARVLVSSLWVTTGTSAGPGAVAATRVFAGRRSG